MANLRIAELDFEQIKTNLKTFLNSQSEFTDYDFEGSGLSVLIDLLAYNTHYNAYLANMLANEMFLDSAVKRASAVSLAKHLGYTPVSARGAKAILNITVSNPTNLPTELTLEKYTTFTSTVNGITYSFLNIVPYVIIPVEGVYTFSSVEVIQGTLLSYNHTVSSPGPGERYEIPNENVDTRSISVSVQTSSTDLTVTSYNLATDITGLTGTSKVFFLQESAAGKYEIFFGDGVIGQKLTAGNIVQITYMVTDGEVANVSTALTQTFALSGTIGGSSAVSISVQSNSTGGADKENITSIKFNAPLYNAAKNRAITSVDYQTLIKTNYTEVESVSVWGGEDNTPPVYGKVFISLKPFIGGVASDALKVSIKNTLLRSRQMLTVIPEFVDPDYIYVTLQGSVYINPSLTTRSTATIKSLINTAIDTFFSTDLQTYDSTFYFSKLQEAISAVDAAIVSVALEPGIQKRITPILNVENSYISENSINFKNRIHPNEITSTRFYIIYNGVTTLVSLKDTPDDNIFNYNGSGTLQLYDDSAALSLYSVGTVNYSTGIITLQGLNPVGYPSDVFDIRISANLQSPNYDILAQKNQIIVKDDSTSSPIANRNAGVNISIISI